MENPILHSAIKGSGVTNNLHRPIHENFDAIDSNIAMIIKDDKERHKTIANHINYNSIDDKMDIMNKKKENMNVKVIDESIKENDQSHQHVDNTKGQGANISLFLNTTHELTVTDLSETPNSKPLHGSLSSIQEIKAHQVDSLYTSFVELLDIQESGSSLFTDNKIVDRGIKKKKNEIKNEKDIYH